MAKFAKGKYALAISDRSGQAFPWREMVTEWNGAFVHISEYEKKQPQLEPKPFVADPQGLEQARPQNFPSNQIGGGNMVANLTLPGDFAFQDLSSGSMVPEDPGQINSRREASIALGSVIAGIPATAVDVPLTGSGLIGAITTPTISTTSSVQNYNVTVASGTLYITGGTGNVFYIDGSRDTSSYLAVGSGTTIRFTQSDSSNDGHPLFISTSNSTDLATLRSAVVSSGVSYYLDGASNQSNYTNTTNFNAATTRYVEWLPASAGTYYYACWIHGIGMGGQIIIA